ncbi:MAG TPA: hypothetical protein VH440_12385 [Candidatus Limnocylindrales bacterium]|jgi:hypothetical protein
MSASTGTIQRPLGQGSIFGAVALAAAVLLAVIAVTWGAMNLTASKSVSTPLAAPTTLDKGSRGELAQPVAVPAPRPDTIIDRGGREVPAAKAIPQVDHTNTGRHLVPTGIPAHGFRAS